MHAQERAALVDAGSWHCTRDDFYLTALLVEKATVSETALRGVFLDIKNCFDSIPLDHNLHTRREDGDAP